MKTTDMSGIHLYCIIWLQYQNVLQRPTDIQAQAWGNNEKTLQKFLKLIGFVLNEMINEMNAV